MEEVAGEATGGEDDGREGVGDVTGRGVRMAADDLNRRRFLHCFRVELPWIWAENNVGVARQLLVADKVDCG